MIADAKQPQASPDIDSVVPGVALNALRTRGLSLLGARDLLERFRIC